MVPKVDQGTERVKQPEWIQFLIRVPHASLTDY